VEEAIKAIEAAKDHPPLRSTTSPSRKTGRIPADADQKKLDPALEPSE
jgi:hypothetical protein